MMNDAFPKILRFRAFYRCAWPAWRVFVRETRYYFHAKMVRSLEDECPAIIVRRMAHGLERVLFHPDRYTEQDILERAEGLRTQLGRKDDRIPATQIAWATRILHEFDSKRSDSRGPVCPLATSGAKRRPAPVAAADLLDLMRQRRSRRLFAPGPLTREEKVALAEAASSAPSTCNRQTLQFLFVENEAEKVLLASTTAGCILLVLADARHYRYPDDRFNPYAEAGAAIQNIYLLCETMGLGCCWGSYTTFGSISAEPDVRRKLHIPDTLLILGAVALGRSNQVVCPIPREEPAGLCHLDTWGNKLK
jgi:nitroreductase